MNRVNLVLVAILWSIVSLGLGQNIAVDLSDTSVPTKEVPLTMSGVILLNRMPEMQYNPVWTKIKRRDPVFSTSLLAVVEDGEQSDSDTIQCTSVDEIISGINGANNESDVKLQVQIGQGLLNSLPEGVCKSRLERKLAETKGSIEFPYAGSLSYNETLTLRIERIGPGGEFINSITFIFSTEEGSRWLTHFGLTYAPNVISSVSQFYSQDSTSAGTYRIAEKSDNGPKAWDNISATINFTYPFHSIPRGVDGGVTAGFGLNPSFQLSGHAGLSVIIGDNIILSSGLAFIQRAKLRGEYHPNQLVKTNLNFDALHERVWLPELFFTIGFRFDRSPFSAPTNRNRASGSDADNESVTNSVSDD